MQEIRSIVFAGELTLKIGNTTKALKKCFLGLLEKLFSVRTGVNSFRNGGGLEPGSKSMSPLMIFFRLPEIFEQLNGDIHPFGDKTYVRCPGQFFTVLHIEPNLRGPVIFTMLSSVFSSFVTDMERSAESQLVRRDSSLCNWHRT